MEQLLLSAVAIFTENTPR